MKWGILTAGKIAQDFATVLTSGHVPGAELVAVAARSLANANEFGDRFKVARRYGSYEELAADPEVQIVYIGSLHMDHLAHSVLCLNAGKHVLCEKPLTLNVGEAEQVLQLAKEKKLFYMEGLWAKFFPTLNAVRDVVRSGVLGSPLRINIDFAFTAGPDAPPRLVKPELAGGATLDIGVYTVAVSSFLVGQPTKLTVRKSNVTDVDISVELEAEYAEGHTSVLTFAFDRDGRNTAIVEGPKGKLEMHRPFWCSTAYTLAVEGAEAKTVETPIPGQDTATTNFLNSMGFQYEARHVQECIQAGLTESPVVPHEDTLARMRVLDEIRRQIGFAYPSEKTSA